MMPSSSRSARKVFCELFLFLEQSSFASNSSIFLRSGCFGHKHIKVECSIKVTIFFFQPFWSPLSLLDTILALFAELVKKSFGSFLHLIEALKEMEYLLWVAGISSHISLMFSLH